MQEGFYAVAWAVQLIALPNIETLEMVNYSEFLQLLQVFPDMQPTHHYLKQVGLFGNWNSSHIEDMKVLYRPARIPSMQTI